MSEPPEIRTRVAHAGWDEHRFRGHRVFAELAGRERFWSLLSLAWGGPRLDVEACDLLDDVAACCTVCDPRIWPLKITRLLAAWGDPMVAFYGGGLALAGGAVGPWRSGEAARFLLDAEAALGDARDDPAAVAALVRARLAEGRLLGFGVPFRPRDERVDALRACLVRRGRHGLRWWRLLESLAAAAEAERKLHPNMTAGIAAACLDLGMSADQIACYSGMTSLANYLANAVEGAAQAPEVLRRLPGEWVRYVGPPPRRSPRAG